ncbi:hypothetical protein BD769DRAFT_1668077 [Suillus cothurnatus]|nr:hypothetical protein BD769DRAFT_1668077 [Suillus cothurnatus]
MPITPHHVPNICLGAVGIRTKVRLFFPQLYDPDRKDVELTFEEKKGLYEKGLMPVLHKLSPDTVTNWAVNYEGVLTRAKKTRGMYQYGTCPFPGNRVRCFGHDLAQVLGSELPWTKGMLFMVQVQGVKEANQHHPGDIDQAEDALMMTLGDFHFEDLMYEDHCYVDVGLEMSEPGYAYQWRTDAHCQLLTTFTDMTGAQANTLMASRDFQIDYASGLMHLSGCRAPVPVRNDEDLVYFQAYTTDNALIQQKDGGRHSLTLTGKAVLAETVPPYLQSLYQLYFDAKDHHDCAVRVEVRLRLKDACTKIGLVCNCGPLWEPCADSYLWTLPNCQLPMLSPLPYGMIAVPLESRVLPSSDVPCWQMSQVIHTTFSLLVFIHPMLILTSIFPANRQWRCVHLQGIVRTLSLQNSGSPELRFTALALTLTAGLQWLANGLHSRPDDSSAARDLMCSILPLTHDYDVDELQIVPRQHHIDNDDGLPFCPYGAYFFREMVFPPIAGAPRMTRSHVISHTSYKYFFGCKFNDLRNRHHPTAYIPHNMLPKSRPSTVFADLDFNVPPPAQDIGEDLPFNERLNLPRGLNKAFPITITKHWNQFCTDILQKCGNLKGNPLAPSHCRLSKDERLHVTDDVYRDTNLAVIFTRVQWKRAHHMEWQEAFNLFFPPPGTSPRLQPQNYPNMIYWMQWSKVLVSFQDAVLDDNFITLPSTYTSSTPHIIINPGRLAPTWDLERMPGGDLEEAEDEEEEEVIDPDYVPASEWISNIPPIPMCIYMRQEEESGSD